MKKHLYIAGLTLIASIGQLRGMDSPDSRAVVPSSSKKISYLAAAQGINSTAMTSAPIAHRNYAEVATAAQMPNELPRHLNPVVIQTMKADDPDYTKTIKSITKATKGNQKGQEGLVAAYRRRFCILNNPNLQNQSGDIEKVREAGPKIKDKLFERLKTKEAVELALAGLDDENNFDLGASLILSSQSTTARTVYQQCEQELSTLSESLRKQAEEEAKRTSEKQTLLDQLAALDAQDKKDSEQKSSQQEQLKRAERALHIATENKKVTEAAIAARRVHKQQLALLEQEQQQQLALLSALVADETEEPTTQEQIELSASLLAATHEALYRQDLRAIEQDSSVLNNLREELSKIRAQSQGTAMQNADSERADSPAAPSMTSPIVQNDQQAITSKTSDLILELMSANIDSDVVTNALAFLEEKKTSDNQQDQKHGIMYATALVLNPNIKEDGHLLAKVKGFQAGYRSLVKEKTPITKTETPAATSSRLWNVVTFNWWS